MTDDARDATAVAQWEDDGGRTNVGARAHAPPRTKKWLYRTPGPATIYLPIFDQCSALWSLGRQSRPG